ncbi:MAG: SAM-dependent methyltransferase, partial [Stellaceae bacterium]
MAEAAARLSAELRRRIAAAGPMSIADYMDAALNEYYARGDPLGARGDFVTSPEVSQVFGELIGLWCADLWQRMGAPDPVLLVELGPGRGTMLKDALRAVARAVPQFRAALRLHLIERSRALRAAQAETLAAAAPAWHDTLDAVPPGPILVIANEFLDALPVRQFVRADGEWRERLVMLAGEPPRLEFALAAVSASDPRLGKGPAGAVRELRPAARALAQHLGARLAAQGGAALVIDYGHEGGLGDTLQA